MRSKDGQVADWKDGSAYAPLREADRSLFAWEWLRRDPDYRAAAGSIAGECGLELVSDERAAKWGLHAFEDPARGFGEARPVWRRGFYPLVLSAEAADDGARDDRFDLTMFSDFTSLIKGPDGGEHVLVSDGRHMLRLDILSGTLCSGPARLHYRIAGMVEALPPLLTLRRFLALWRTGDFSRSLHPPEARAARWILLLRTYDGLAGGAGQREIAEHLLDTDAAGARWRVAAPALRSRVQRLVRDARRMAGGGYRELLAERGWAEQMLKDQRDEPGPTSANAPSTGHPDHSPP